MSTKKRFLFSILIVIVAILGVVIWQRQHQPSFSVQFFDVGQGDASLVTFGCCTQVLIDGGPDRAILEKLGAAMPFYDHNIEAVVLTHAHADHLAGLVEVAKRYQFGQVFTGAVMEENDLTKEWQSALSGQNIQPKVVDKDLTVNIDAARLDIFYPAAGHEAEAKKDLNVASLVARWQIGEESFLFAGDLPTAGEDWLIGRSVFIKSKVLKVGHHGSSGSSGANILAAVDPEYAVISVGENSYGHPAKATLDRLKARPLQILRIDQSGDIIFSWADNTLKMTTSR